MLCIHHVAEINISTRTQGCQRAEQWDSPLHRHL